jgi:hypothetical protein
VSLRSFYVVVVVKVVGVVKVVCRWCRFMSFELLPTKIIPLASFYPNWYNKPKTVTFSLLNVYEKNHKCLAHTSLRMYAFTFLHSLPSLA